MVMGLNNYSFNHSFNVGSTEDLQIKKDQDDTYWVMLSPPVSIDGKYSVFHISFKNAAEGQDIDLSKRYTLSLTFRVSSQNGSKQIDVDHDGGLSMKESPEFGHFIGDEVVNEILTTKKYII